MIARDLIHMRPAADLFHSLLDYADPEPVSPIWDRAPSTASLSSASASASASGAAAQSSVAGRGSAVLSVAPTAGTRFVGLPLDTRAPAAPMGSDM